MESELEQEPWEGELELEPHGTYLFLESIPLLELIPLMELIPQMESILRMEATGIWRMYLNNNTQNTAVAWWNQE